jgi:hypothetical protein
MKTRGLVAALLLLATTAFASVQGDLGVQVIPKPAQVIVADGRFVFTEDTVLRPGPGGEPAARLLADALKTRCTLDLPLRTSGAGAVSLTVDPALPLGGEGYRLAVSSRDRRASAGAGCMLDALAPLHQTVEEVKRRSTAWPATS